MRRFFNALMRAVAGESSEPQMVDHVAIKDSALDWRDAKVVEAAARYGKPFKCCTGNVPREVLIGGRELVTVDAEKPVPTMFPPKATVTSIKKARKS